MAVADAIGEYNFCHKIILQSMETAEISPGRILSFLGQRGDIKTLKMRSATFQEREKKLHSVKKKGVTCGAGEF